MTNYDVVKKLIGPIEPIGESDEDEIRLENLKKLCELAGIIISEIDTIGHRYKESHMSSVKKIGVYANQYLKRILGN